MEDKKYCPLKLPIFNLLLKGRALNAFFRELDVEDYKCDRSNCAWFVENNVILNERAEACAILSIAKAMKLT